MSRVDLVVFGATGFTGKHAVEHLAKRIKGFSDVTWAIAGRSKKKLEDLLQEISKKTDADLSAVKIIVADVSDYDSVENMCGAARVVVNCCGPYRLHGEPVVRAAIHARAHYVDVSGEPQFIETMQLKYDKEAREAGVYVVSACGFDSIPNDMGVVFLQKHFDGTLNSVESYMSTSIPSEYYGEIFRNGCINYGTWESLVHSLSHSNELKPLRNKLYPLRLPSLKPKLKPRSAIHRHEGTWCVPFMGADSSIVYRTQRYFYETEKTRPAQFRPYFQYSGLLQVILLFIFGGIILLMAKYEFTKQLLLDYPRIFSCGLVTKKGPKREMLEKSSFCVELRARGWGPLADAGSEPNDTLVAKVSAKDPGYGFTSIALLLSALTVLKESDQMPQNGGVLTTGAAFRNTRLIENLQKNDCTFQIVGTQ